MNIYSINKDEIGTIYRSRRRQRTRYNGNSTRDTPSYVTSTKGINIIISTTSVLLKLRARAFNPDRLDQ